MDLTPGQIQSMNGKDITPAQARAIRNSGWQPQNGTLEEWLLSSDRLQAWLVIAGSKHQGQKHEQAADGSDAVVYKFSDYAKGEG